jgi:hypothetical protein
MKSKNIRKTSGNTYEMAREGERKFFEKRGMKKDISNRWRRSNNSML